MRVSKRWLSELVDLSKLTDDALSKMFTDRGLEVEVVHDLSAGFDKVETVQIQQKERHPDADKLSLCRVTTGKGDPLDIVCGAKNMKEGDIVALANIGARLPNGLEIKQSKIRGQTSHGMLCSESELGLSEESDGIIVLPKGTPIGKPLKEILGRDDVVFELNVTPNRGDCMSHVGVAREIAAATGQKLKIPPAKLIDLKGSKITTGLDAGENGPQFFGCMIEGVTVGPSPSWVVEKLEAVGARSINNVVDATNIVLYELGQPTHAYDADRLNTKKLVIANATKGEKLPLLDGSSVTLTGEELVIADGDRAVALAGVMGGGNSEVLPETRRIYLECAEFSPTRTRLSAQKHAKFSDSSQRFERGINPIGLHHAISRLARLIEELSGGRVAGGAMSMSSSRNDGAPKIDAIDVEPKYFSHFLGMQVSDKDAKAALTSLGCEVAIEGSGWRVHPPAWRWDLRIKEDLAEEVARTVGYDKIASTIPVLTSPPKLLRDSESSSMFRTKAKALGLMSDLGFSEALNFAFLDKKSIEAFGLQPEVRLQNPLSEELEYLVPSLLPGLFNNAVHNLHGHHGSEPLSVRLFQVRPTFHRAGADGSSEAVATAISKTETDVEERWKLSFLATGVRLQQALRAEQTVFDFYDLKAMLETFFERMGTRGVRWAEPRAVPEWMHPGQCADILIGKDNIGTVGQLHPGMSRKEKFKDPVWVGELDWGPIIKMSLGVGDAKQFKMWSNFPGIERDFAILVSDSVKSDKITQVVMRAGKPLAKVVKIFDIYRGSPVPEGMTSIAIRVIFSNETRSLQESEAETVSEKILQQLKGELGAQLRT